MWPEGAQAVTEVTKRPKSTGTIFKESMIALVANLKTKVNRNLIYGCYSEYLVKIFSYCCCRCCYCCC